MRVEKNEILTPSFPQAFAVGVIWPNHLSVCVKIKVIGSSAQQLEEDCTDTTKGSTSGEAEYYLSALLLGREVSAGRVMGIPVMHCQMIVQEGALTWIPW